MLDIREIELEIVDQKQTPRYVSKFKPLLYISAFTQKDFHYAQTGPPTQGTSTKEFVNANLEVYNSSLNTTTSTQEASTKPNFNNHLYTRGIGTKPKLQPQSPLHKRDEHKSKAQPPLHLEG